MFVTYKKNNSLNTALLEFYILYTSSWSPNLWWFVLHFTLVTIWCMHACLFLHLLCLCSCLSSSLTVCIQSSSAPSALQCGLTYPPVCLTYPFCALFFYRKVVLYYLMYHKLLITVTLSCFVKNVVTNYIFACHLLLMCTIIFFITGCFIMSIIDGNFIGIFNYYCVFNVYISFMDYLKFSTVYQNLSCKLYH